MVKIKNGEMILNNTEMISVIDMIENIPYYLALENVKLSAISNVIRKDILKEFKKYEEEINRKGMKELVNIIYGAKGNKNGK